MKWLRGLYDWVLSWADSPYGALALFLLAVAESSFFPIPPDVLLIALCMGAYRRSMWFAAICSVGSVIGGAIGYLIGWKCFELVGVPIINAFASMEAYDRLELLFEQYGLWIVGTAGFTPIPYKLFTIAAGACHMSFVPFVAISAVSRSARFFLVAGIVQFSYKRFGDRIQGWIDRYFNLLSIAFVVLLILGFVVIKLWHG
ncbi:YqaA family protein [Candidatus Sumerlaeota bacterium]